VNALELAAESIAYANSEPVLRDVHFAVAPGESVALLGGNGSGKTALLRYIAGLLPQSSGHIRVHGTAIRSTRAAVAAGVGLLVQDPQDQLLGTTLLEDTLIGPRNLQLSAAECDARAEEALSTVELLALAEREVETLSIGQQKRAALAGVLAMKPRLLLLDEPTAGLDPRAERSVCETLLGLREAGNTLLVATHAVDLVPYFATRVVLLAEGRILADGPCREVLCEAELLARARVRCPWTVELWSRKLREHMTQAPLTLEELLGQWPQVSAMQTP
jgi:cobalt/nickel transport system ATP-binding protein